MSTLLHNQKNYEGAGDVSYFERFHQQAHIEENIGHAIWILQRGRVHGAKKRVAFLMKHHV